MTYDAYKTEASPWKIRRTEKDPVRFRVQVTCELGFEFKIFVKAIHNIDWFLSNFDNFSDPFDIFYLLIAII